VIAKHSPERILEGELPMEALEKNHGKDNDAAQQARFSGPVCLPNIAKSPPFPQISRATPQSFCAVEKGSAFELRIPFQKIR
jgi:hypothetical protein